MHIQFIVLWLVALFGACENPETSFKNSRIQNRHMLPEQLSESSGLMAFNGLIWTFNDSGGKPEIYGYSVEHDSIVQTVKLKNAINKDWEDITQDKEFIYVGDFGNNQGSRDSLVIYKIAKKSIPPKGNAIVNADKIIFTYPGYTPVKIAVSFSAFDCEAMVSVKDSLYIFTKDWTSGTSTLYSLPKKAGKYLAIKHQKLKVNGLITGAEIHNNRLFLIGYSSFVPFIIEYPFNDISKLTDKNAQRFDLTEISTYQTEGICFDDNRILISSEKTRSPAQIMEISLN